MPRAKKKETEAPAGAVTETVQRMPLSELHPFEGHPFKVLDDDSMTETVESIRQMGVANPLIVRPDPDGGYEIISGHRRRHAAELAGLDTIPVIVRELDDDAAVIMMVDSNLQRENILPSERAKAYKMKLEALKHQGQRHDLTSTQVVEKLAAEQVGDDAGISRESVRRFVRLEKLQATERKDDVITFEQLGVDRLFVDEAHAFKNLFLYTKMRNVAGLSTSEAQKSSDMFMKCQYMDELTGGKGTVFATGTPVSNSMTELYTMMRYLQHGTLRQKGLTHFDQWASTFGETTTAIELAPEGTGYRARTRFANRNKQVQIFQYVTEGTFDAYLYQTLENKQKFISQIMTSKSPVRSCDDVDEQALSYAEIKALCAGNPLIREKMDLDVDVAKLKVLRADYQSKHFRLEDQLLKYFPAEIEAQQSRNKGFEADIQTVEAHPLPEEGFVGIELAGKHYAEKADAGEALLALCKEIKSTDGIPIGSYRGFQMELSYNTFEKQFQITLKGEMSHRVSLGTDARGNLTRLDNALAGIPGRLERGREQLENLRNQQAAAQVELTKPFPQEAELAEKSARLAELDAALSMEDSIDRDGGEVSEEVGDGERPSVLEDLKKRAAEIPPDKKPGKELERG